ncbi:MAG TPA: hypothetical protein VK995_03695 [Oceanipulchritudo sp.]|nr:hypothetical protein [Oceanipulchritudo sp.]
MKVFLDANILFSASNPQWLTRHLLDALEQSGAALTSSDYVWDEAERNVRSHLVTGHYKQFGDLMGLTLSAVKIVSQRPMAEELNQL